MPYVLKHRETSQIYTCILVNHYRLAYYGVKFWQDEAAALAEASDFLAEQAAYAASEAKANTSSTAGGENTPTAGGVADPMEPTDSADSADSADNVLNPFDPTLWEIIELDEPTMKIGNVKLKNDPSYCLYLNADGRPVAERFQE